jgi:predicted RNase H-like HicB family nuclease
MFAEYIAVALERAEYEIIEDPDPYYAHVPGLPVVWATGKTFEECRRELISVIEGWIVLGRRMGRQSHLLTATLLMCLWVSKVAIVQKTLSGIQA